MGWQTHLCGVFLVMDQTTTNWSVGGNRHAFLPYNASINGPWRIDFSNNDLLRSNFYGVYSFDASGN